MSIDLSLREGLEKTSKEIQQINSHLKTIQNQKNKDLKPNEVSLLYGRLQYQVQKLQNDFNYQSKELQKNIQQNNKQNKIQKLPILDSSHRPTSSFSQKQNNVMTYKPRTGFYKYSHLERNNSQRQILKESQQFLKTEKKGSQSIEITQYQPLKQTTQATLRSIQQDQFNKGRLSKKPNILPKNIRNNPMAELPFLTDKDIQKKGIFNLQNAGLAYKDIDTEAVFTQGDPVLQVQQKEIIVIEPDPNEPLDKKIKSLTKYVHLENMEKYKLDEKYMENYDNNNNQDQSDEDNSNNIFLTAQMDNQYQLTPINNGPNTQNTSKMENQNKILEIDQYRQNQINDIPIEQMDFVILIELDIVQYKLNENCENFPKFKARYSHIWGSVKGIIQKLENITKKCRVQMAKIDGKKIGLLAQDDLYRAKDSDLLECFLSSKLISSYYDIKGTQKGKTKIWGASKIWRSYKMYKAQQKLKQLKMEKKAEQLKKNKVTFWLSFLISNLTIRKNISKKMKLYKEVSEEFKKNWNEIKTQKRVEIHMNSLGFDPLKRYSMDNFQIRENLQLARLFRLKDPNLEIIIVSPFPLHKEIISYYYKICELQELDNFKDRIHFKHPENYDKFPEYFPVSKLLYYSPFAINEIKELIRDKTAYIVPGYPNKEDILLGMYLGVPVFQGDIQAHQKYSKKKFAKEIFNECGFPVPPGVENIKEKNQLFDQLTKLIYTTPAVKTWVFKIDDEFQGRGLAYFSIDSIRVLNEIFKEQNSNLNEEQKLRHLQKIKEIVINLLPSRLEIVQKSLYPTFDEFVAPFLKSGGVIEACPNAKDDQINSPSIILRIDPNGSHIVLGTYDRIGGAQGRSQYINYGCIYPQTSLPHLNFKKISQILAENLYSKGIFGYITIDMISFVTQNQKGSHPLFQVVDMDCYLNNFTASYFLFDFLIAGKLDKVYGKYYLKKEGSQAYSQNDQNDDENNENSESNMGDIDESEERCFMYAPILQHEGLKKMNFRDFFQACRKNQISYDLEKKMGSVFMLSNSLQSGIISLLTIQDSSRKVVKSTTEALNFLLNVAGNSSKLESYDKQNMDNFYLMDFVQKIRNMNKQNDKIEQMQAQQSVMNGGENTFL